jgi:6,7-dimethyl-8-ribityllumazine synthase
MAAKRKNLSVTAKHLPSGKGRKMAVVVSKWNPEITEALFEGAHKTLMENGSREKEIIRIDVPGSYELPSAAALLCGRKDIDAVICLGCVIQGETRHFDFICQAVAQGLIDVSLKYNKPVIFGVLTTNTFEQAMERSGGKHGNKGVEAAATALQMCELFGKKKK